MIAAYRVTLLHLQRFAGTRSWGASRRILAVICALSLLAVSLAHAVDDADAAAPRTSIVLLKSSTGQPDQKAPGAVPCHHCFCCTGAMAEPMFITSVASRIGSDLVALPIAEMHSHDPALQTPPPKL
jgi:hypothetical protein